VFIWDAPCMESGFPSLAIHFHLVLKVINLCIDLVVVLVVTVRPLNKFLPFSLAVLLIIERFAARARCLHEHLFA
jgi:hypothetical protein